MIQHFQDFFFQGHRGELFAGISGMQAHGNGNAAAVDKKSHFNDRIRAVFLADPELAQAVYDFSGDLVHDIIVWLFAFTIEIRAVVIKDGGIPFYDGTAVLVKPGQVVLIIVRQQIHKPEDMLVTEIRLFKIRGKPSPCSEFGGGIQDSGIGQKTGYRITVKGDLSVTCLLSEKFFEL